jgi:hypothetical protein
MVKGMNVSNPLGQIRDRIKNSNPGTVFITSDFLDLTDYVNAKKCLSRLAESGFLRRIIRGVYDYPEYSDFLGEYAVPSPHKVALALARNFGWTVVPDGDTALNQLGLSTQVPAYWTYVSDGPYKEYVLNKSTIRFKHTANKDISHLSYKSALFVQAIKAIGKNDMDGRAIRKMSSLLSAEEKAVMLADGKHITSWVYNSIKEICDGKNEA